MPRCTFCGIPILPDPTRTICSSSECAELLEESRHPERFKPISSEEFAAFARLMMGRPAGGYGTRLS